MESASAAWEAEQNKNFCCHGVVSIELYSSGGSLITTITSSEVASFTLTERADRYANTMPENKLVLDLLDPNTRLSTYDLATGNILKVKMGYEYTSGTTEYVDGGTFYIQKVDKSDNGLVRWSITAKDRLSTLTNTYDKGAYVPPGNYNKLYNLAKNVFNDLGMVEGTDYVISDINHADLKSANILPKVTHATALQTIANACSCTLYCGRNGKIYITPPKANLDYTLINKCLYKKPSVKSVGYYPNFQTTLHNFRVGNMVDVATITKTVTGTETIILQFSEPVLYPTVYLKSGTGSISNITTYARYAVFDLTASGTSATIAVQGMPMIPVNETYYYEGGLPESLVYYSDNPLYSVTDGFDLMGLPLPPTWESTIEWRSNPRIGVGDRVYYDSNGAGQDNYFVIEECKIVYNGGYKGTIKGRF